MLIIVYYNRVRAALEAFLERARKAREHELRKIDNTVATPEQGSGMSVEAVIFLCGHRRQEVEEFWYAGHASQFSRRYVGMTRASEQLYLILEGLQSAR